MLRLLIDAYYQFRGYVNPSLIQAMLFLISEVGELAQAILDSKKRGGEVLAPADERVLLEMVAVGDQADRIVGKQSSWIRNNDRSKQSSVPDEIADVLMMLDRVAKGGGYDETVCLQVKMGKKGFTGITQAKPL